MKRLILLFLLLATACAKNGHMTSYACTYSNCSVLVYRMSPDLCGRFVPLMASEMRPDQPMIYMCVYE